MLKFNKRILVIGYGGVAQCTLPVLFNHLELDYSQVTVIDLVDKSNLIIALPTNKKIITESKMYDLMEEKFSSDLNKCQSDKKKEEINKAKDDKI
jgi:homospermidine synthase